MNNLKVFGKFLDQPILISKLNKTMPTIMTIGASAILANNSIDSFQKTKTEEEKDAAKKEIFKKGIIMAASVASALIAPKIASKIAKREPIETFEKIAQKNQELIEKFLKDNNINADVAAVLNKAKNEVLSLSEIKKLASELTKNSNGEKLFNELIPDPENIKAADIFSEIGYLSIFS